MDRDFIVLLVGKSGCGKTSVCSELERYFEWKVLQSYTTRPKRSEDETGHTFITEDEFDNLRDICAYTKFDGYRYCATAEQVNEADIYVIDPDGLKDFRKNYPGPKIVIPIYLWADDETLKKRMEERGDSKLNITRRLWHDKVKFRGVEDLIQVHIDATEELAIVVANVYKTARMLASMTNMALKHHKESEQKEADE